MFNKKLAALTKRSLFMFIFLISDFGKTFRTASSLLCIRKQLFFQIAAYIIHIWGCQDKGRISFKIRCMIVLWSCTRSGTSTGSEDFSFYNNMPWRYTICIAQYLYTCRGDLIENFGKTIAQKCKKSTSGWRASKFRGKPSRAEIRPFRFKQAMLIVGAFSIHKHVQKNSSTHWSESLLRSGVPRSHLKNWCFSREKGRRGIRSHTLWLHSLNN